MIFSTATVYIKKLIGRQKYISYEDLIIQYAVPYITNELGKHYILQQDNCSIHISKKMLQAFEDSNISILELPSRSPDLNIVKNVWKMLTDFVYNGLSFNNLRDLEDRIEAYII